jgi:hypothetical protein
MNMKTRRCYGALALSISSIASSSLASLGCGGNGTGDPSRANAPADVAASPPETASVQRTIVRFHEDGKTTVDIGQITPSELRAEVAARKEFLAQATGAARGVRPLIAVDGGCSAADIWLVDQPDFCWDLFKHDYSMMCFYGQGESSLPDVGSPIFPAVQSYWPGTEDGWLGRHVGFQLFAEHFVAYQPCTVAGIDAQNANLVYLTD